MSATTDRLLGDHLANALRLEKVKLLAELLHAKEPRLSEIREEIDACFTLLSRPQKMLDGGQLK